jgi:hypothetical protein
MIKYVLKNVICNQDLKLEERTDHHAPSMKKGPREQEEQKERMSAADREEEGAFRWEKELRYHWMGGRRGCTQIER